MSVVHVGTSPLLTDSETVFDPRYGYQLRETYVGRQVDLLTIANAFNSVGLRTTQAQRGGMSSLQVFYALDPNSQSPETPTDYYELETEYVQESIWSCNKLEELAGDVATLAQWRRETESAMKGRLLDAQGNETSKVEGPLSPEVFVDGNLKDVYTQVVKDGTAYETTRQVLTRVRTISIAYSAPTVAQVRETVYSTSALIATFGIPSGVAAKLPADPTAVPSKTQWGWKQRRNTSRYEWNGRVSEAMSWTFAAWSTLTYDHV